MERSVSYWEGLPMKIKEKPPHTPKCIQNSIFTSPTTIELLNY
jgi:hypothetical protein